MSTQNSQCSCNAAPKLVFPCSGAADVGELSDHAARLMSREGTGKMYCLAGIGGRVEAILANTRGAARVLVIDGCSQECARKTLDEVGLKGFEHLKLWEMGYRKGETPVTPERVRAVANAGAALLRT